MTKSLKAQPPVLFLIFNRPDLTAQVMEKIREIAPSRLYVAGDGPRVGVVSDKGLVAEARAHASAVDWQCDLKTRYLTENIGCKYAVSQAVTWFFQHEPSGIILEDDCVPHPDFFKYCEFCLSEFRDHRDVWHINGNNFGAPQMLYRSNSLDFVSLAQPWGWATWADRWKHFEINAFRLADRSKDVSDQWEISKKRPQKEASPS